MTYAEIKDALLADTAIEHGRGATGAEIESAERQIGRLPTEYASFLRDFGWLALAQFELSGLGKDVPSHLSLVEVAKEEQQYFGLPSNLVPILNDGGGNLYCFDTAASTLTPGNVLCWDHEAGPSQTPRVVASSFGDWLEVLIQSRVV